MNYYIINPGQFYFFISVCHDNIFRIFRHFNSSNIVYHRTCHSNVLEQTVELFIILDIDIILREL